MAFSSLPLYHLDPQACHNQQSNDEQQILLQSQQHEDIISSQLRPPQPTPLSQSGVVCGGSTTGSIKPNSMVDRARHAQVPLPEPGLKCPRCESTNTKFCYFNNYNLSQPRHFCKTCRRYWTRGGSLRNIPVGGGCRRTAKRTKPRPVTAGPGGGLRSLGNPISSNLGGSSIGGNNMLQLPFLPSLHYLGNSTNPNGIGVEMEFPNLLPSFEELGRMNIKGIHPFESPSHINLIGHSFHQSRPSDDQIMDQEIIDSRALVKFEDRRGVNLSKEFALVQGNNHRFNWNTQLWSNGSDLSGFDSPSSANHLLG